MLKKSFLITDKNAAEYAERIGGFIRKKVAAAGREGIVLGMSGGIDSAVAARLCQIADVPVLLIMMPDGGDMERSQSMRHAKTLIDKFGFDCRVIDIGPACAALEAAAGGLSPLSKSNLRPRARMAVLYSVAQTMRRFVMGTSNLCERLTGYFTKWGDGASDINPLGMLVKEEIRVLGRFLEIPAEIITKAPSAGLFEGQTDEADLGVTYARLDAYALAGTSGDAAADKIIEERIKMSRHKRVAIPIFKG